MLILIVLIYLLLKQKSVAAHFPHNLSFPARLVCWIQEVKFLVWFYCCLCLKLIKQHLLGLLIYLCLLLSQKNHGSLFSLQYKFSRKTQTQHSSGENFKNVFHSLSMYESYKNSLCWDWLFNLFIIVTETCCSSFSSQFKFSRKTHTQHSSGEIFKNVLNSLSMDESYKNSSCWEWLFNFVCYCNRNLLQLIFFTI